MKMISKKILAAALAAAVAVSASACSFGKGSNESDTDTNGADFEITQTDTETESDTESEVDTDIGIHKDYDKEECEGFYDSGVLVIDQDGHKRGMDMFAGTNADFYANELNILKESVGSKVKVYSMIVPTACEFYTPANYLEDITSQNDVIEDVGEKLMDVINVNPTETLLNHNGEDIFARTDHHWQALGAYYACKVFAKAAGVDYADISTYQKIDVDGYVGSLPNFMMGDGGYALENDPEVFTYYVPSNKYTTFYYDQAFQFISSGELLAENTDTRYLTFIGGDSYSVKVHTDVKNSRNLLVIKDSFGNAAIPFLTSSFTNIYVVDMRYFEANIVELVEEFGITDVLFLMNSYSAVGGNAQNLETLRTQATPGNLQDDASDVDFEDDVAEDSSSDSMDNDNSSDANSYVDNTSYGVGLNNPIDNGDDLPDNDESYDDGYNDSYDDGYDDGNVEYEVDDGGEDYYY